MKKLFFTKSLLKIILFIFIIAVCYWCSQNICYYYLDDIAVLFFSQLYQFIVLRIILSNLIFFLINYIFHIFDIKPRSFLIYCFTLFLLSAIIISFRPTTMRVANFNISDYSQIWNSQQSSKILLFANTFLYLPLGYFYQKLSNEKSIILIIDFLIFISFIELFQYYLKLGVFDVYDILFNTLGFSIGLLIERFIKAKWRLHNE